MSAAYSKLKQDLKGAGKSLRSISREVGVSHTAVTDVARGARRSRRIEQIIASHLNVKPSDLWPDRYEQQEGNT